MDPVHVPAYRTHYRDCNTLGVGTRDCRLQGRDFLLATKTGAGMTAITLWWMAPPHGWT